MPSRLDRVRVSTRYGECEIGWECRERLLAEMRQVDSQVARDAIGAFEAAGTSEPVRLNRGGKVLVVEAINSLDRDADGIGPVSTGLRELRRALADELDRDPIG